LFCFGFAALTSFGFQKIFCKERKTFSEPSENARACLGRRVPRIASRGVSRSPSETWDQKEISKMATTSVATAQQNTFTNQILHGDCIEVMHQMPANSVDFILTDPRIW
jgi:hypothetical protein